MKVILALFLSAFLSSVSAQRISPENQAPIQRRQLTQVQQNHILTDIQQHQHRFSTHQNQHPQFRNQFNGRQQPFVQQASQSFAFPPQTSVVSNARFLQQQIPNQQASPAFTQNIIQPQTAPGTSQAIRQTQFQRSVQNQVGQVGLNQQSQFNQFQTQTASNRFSQPEQFNSFNRPIPAALIQQQQSVSVRQQQNFLPNSQVQFPSQNAFQPQLNYQPEPSRLINGPQFNAPQTNIQQPQNQFLQPSQALPVEQRVNFFHDTRTDEQRQKEFQLRQKLIEKQEKYAQKYYQKQQQQVSKLHEDFVRQQQQIQEKTQEKLRPQQSQLIQQSNNRHQGVQPTDYSAFEKSVQQYYQQYPTTTTTSTTQAPATTSSPLLTVVPLKKNKNKTEVKTLNSEDIQKLLQGNRQNLFSQLKQETSKKISSPKSQKSPLGRDELLKQLQKLALSDGGEELGDKKFTSQDIVLANGERVQVIRTSDPELIRKAKAGNNQIIEQSVATTTQPPLSFADLAKSGILPPGADFEVIKQSDNRVQRVQKVPQQQKVTFVYLEELDDGSYKVQGVKSNSDKEAKRSGAEVDSILNRIKTGEIQLPPAAKGAEKSIIIPTPAPTTTVHQKTSFKQSPSSDSVVSLSSSSTMVPNNHRNSNQFSSLVRSSTSSPKNVTVSRQTSAVSRQTTRGSSPVFQYSFSATTPQSQEDNGRSPYSTLPTFSTSEKNNYYSVNNRVQRLSTTEVPEYATASSINFIQSVGSQMLVGTTRGQFVSSSTSSPTFASSIFSSPSYSPSFTTTLRTTTASAISPAPELANILRNAGLFAMAKYLKQSGLDSILNETGPYTIFAPTDKAFKSLLVQLGGPEKAEEKFKNNPRLLSGLLLHHVIPGSFKIDELQDEMTGVSLAGTQLRVNQYQMQDTEWNDVKVTTINGATVANDNNDIMIPQGVAHSVDRVMFPLPVGDILQTLQSDRERRFTHFLRAIFASNMADTLQNKGIKTYTVFAPTDLAFAHLTQEELNLLVSDKDSAQQLVQRHVLPGTLFTSGMRFYQVKDTLAEEKAVTVQKNGGKVKVNESTILTSNIPSTNGVIHAIDTLL